MLVLVLVEVLVLVVLSLEPPGVRSVTVVVADVLAGDHCRGVVVLVVIDPRLLEVTGIVQAVNRRRLLHGRRSHQNRRRRRSLR